MVTEPEPDTVPELEPETTTEYDEESSDTPMFDDLTTDEDHS